MPEGPECPAAVPIAKTPSATSGSDNHPVRSSSPILRTACSKSQHLLSPTRKRAEPRRVTVIVLISSGWVAYCGLSENTNFSGGNSVVESHEYRSARHARQFPRFVSSRTLPNVTMKHKLTSSIHVEIIRKITYRDIIQSGIPAIDFQGITFGQFATPLYN